MQKTWFTADLHFWHKNICRYSHRPFSSVEEMNEGLIANFNSVVQPFDFVYHLGDFAFGNRVQKQEIFARLNGIWTFVLGNHDGGLEKSLLEKWPNDKGRGKITGFHNLLIKSINGVQFVMCHYAMRTWPNSQHGTIQLYGHSHGTLPHHQVNGVFLKCMDVGVDSVVDTHRTLFPYSFDEVVEIMKTRGIFAQDHHTEDCNP